MTAVMALKEVLAEQQPEEQPTTAHAG